MECKPSTTIVALGELGITVFQQWHQVHFLVGISATPPCLRRQGGVAARGFLVALGEAVHKPKNQVYIRSGIKM